MERLHKEKDLYPKGKINYLISIFKVTKRLKRTNHRVDWNSVGKKPDGCTKVCEQGILSK